MHTFHNQRQNINQPACFKKKSGVLQLTIPSTQLARSGSASWFTSRSNVSCRMRLGGFQHPGRWWLVPWQVSPPCDVLFALGLTMLISIHTKKVFPDRNMFHKYVFKPELSNIVCTCSTFWIITARNWSDEGLAAVYLRVGCWIVWSDHIQSLLCVLKLNCVYIPKPMAPRWSIYNITFWCLLLKHFCKILPQMSLKPGFE